MPNNNFAIVCASGIGDALLMQIIAAHLQTMGHTAVLFSDHLNALAPWFPGFCFKKGPPNEAFDAIVLQHDNTAKAQNILSLPKPVYALYGEHCPRKHGALRAGLDVVCDRSLCMAQNIARACDTWFPGTLATLHNGLAAPAHLTFRKYPRRVAIHPSSSTPSKNWNKRSFLKLYEHLLQAGYEPTFITPTLFPSLADLAAFLYESGSFIGNDSGPGHLASNLGLPTLTIGPSKEHLLLWRPGWSPGAIAHPPRYLPKLFRNKWAHFITVNQVFKLFTKLSEINCCNK